MFMTWSDSKRVHSISLVIAMDSLDCFEIYEKFLKEKKHITIMSSMKALNKWRFVRFTIMKALGHSVFFTLLFIMRTQTYFFLLLVCFVFTNWGVCINLIYISYLLGLFAVSLTIFITDLYFFIWKRRIKKNTIDHKMYVSIWFRE